MINVFEPAVGPEDIGHLREVFESRWLGYGARSRELEEKVAERFHLEPEGTAFVTSGTAALFLAAATLDLGPGDEVVMPSISFVGAANAVAERGATVRFCDVDPVTLNPTADHVRAALSDRTRAVVVLHYGGQPGSIKDIAQVCRDWDVALIEDAANAIGSSVDGQPCGTFGDLAIWSLDPMKTITSGEGGILYARDPAMAQRARNLAYHGLSSMSGFSASETRNRAWWEFDVHGPGRRDLGNDITAAIGLSQIKRLDEFLWHRQDLVNHYRRNLRLLPQVTLPRSLPTTHVSGNYMFWIQVEPDVRDQLAAHLLSRGIYTTFRYHPLHTVALYNSTHTDLPGAVSAAARTLVLPLHNNLTHGQVDEITTTIGAFLAADQDMPSQLAASTT